MVHPVKTPLGAARVVTHLSVQALRHPLRSVSDAASFGRGLLGSVGSVVSAVTPGGRSGGATAERAPGAGPVPPTAGVAPTPDPATGAPAGEAAAPRKLHGDPLDATAGGEADAATTTAEPGEPHAQVVTEPSAVTAVGDDEEIPSSAVPFEDDDVEVMTPVGTTGAGVGYNPDTNETDLQQPGTEPLMDPSTTKRIKSETDTLRKAADTQKG